MAGISTGRTGAPAAVTSTSAALAHPLAPHVILGVPPLILLSGAQETEPEIDHVTLAADHRGAARHVERAVLQPDGAGLEGLVAGLVVATVARLATGSRRPLRAHKPSGLPVG